MSRRPLEGMMMELERRLHVYSLEMADEMDLRMQREPSIDRPHNYLVLWQGDQCSSLPLSPITFSLQDADATLERLANEELDYREAMDMSIRVSSHIGNLKWPGSNRIDISGPQGPTEEAYDPEAPAQVQEKAVSRWRNFFERRMNYLQKLCDTLTQQTQSWVREHVEQAEDRDRDYIRRFDRIASDVEQMEDMMNLNAVLRWPRRIVNTVTLGSKKRQKREELEVYAMRNVGWQAMGYAAQWGAEQLKCEADYLETEGEETLARGVRGISHFYGNVSAAGFAGEERMRRLLNRAGHVYANMFGATAPDVDVIGEQVLAKALGYNSR